MVTLTHSAMSFEPHAASSPYVRHTGKQCDKIVPRWGGIPTVEESYGVCEQVKVSSRRMQTERMEHSRNQRASEVTVDHFLRKEELRTASWDEPERWESLPA